MGYALSIFLGLASGAAISGAVFAFLAAIGIVPVIARKTKTQEHIMLYETALILGGIFGAFTMVFNFFLPFNLIIIAILALCVGIFIGTLAMSLAETLDVLPILSRRLSLKTGMKWFIMALALGKMVGSILYFTITAFQGNP